MFQVKNKHLFDVSFLKQDSPDVENVNHLAHSKHELDLVKFVLSNFSVVLVSYLNSVRSLFIHVNLFIFSLVDFGSQINVHAF